MTPSSAVVGLASGTPAVVLEATDVDGDGLADAGGLRLPDGVGISSTTPSSDPGVAGADGTVVGPTVADACADGLADADGTGVCDGVLGSIGGGSGVVCGGGAALAGRSRTQPGKMTSGSVNFLVPLT
jgi:hypothetical protein